MDFRSNGAAAVDQAKPDHVRALLDRLRRVREIGVPPEAAGRIHEDRFQQLIREARISDAHQTPRSA